MKNAIIFCNRKVDVADLYKSLLSKSGLSAGAIHGDLDQSTRTKTLDGFRKGTIRLLVASDVAARGLDIPDVSHVFNYDVPSHAEDYVHRIGRTGRAGKTGTAYTLATREDGKSIWPPSRSRTGSRIPALEKDAAAGSGRDSTGRARKLPPPPKKTARRKPNGAVDAAAAAARTKLQPSPLRKPLPRPKRPKRRTTAALKRRRSPRRNRHAVSAVGRGQAIAIVMIDQPVVGLGDHVPAFILRAVKLPKKNAKEADDELETESEDA